MKDENKPTQHIDSVWGNIFGKKEKVVRSIENVLINVPIFSTLQKRELRNVALIVHDRTYAPGEHIFYQQDPGLGMYVIKEGEVSIKLESPEKELARLKEGAFFGELALLDESPRSASAIAVTQCQLIGFFRPDLFKLVEKNPRTGLKIVLKLAEIIGERLRISNQNFSKAQAELSALRVTFEEFVHK
ncbi:MAG: cyclic nucleotide-binding domain-containing protein [Ignavibacteriales bacterium]|nr:cyclic nucleotide-binding domain-containing protein [Ignavibacteriales bacterium]